MTVRPTALHSCPYGLILSFSPSRPASSMVGFWQLLFYFLFAEAAGAIFRKSCILQICVGNTQGRNCIFYQQMDTSLKNQIICLLWIYALSLWRDICGFYDQENGHWNHPCGFSLDRHIYLAASHCHTQLKLDGWLRLGGYTLPVSWTSSCMLVHRQTFSGWSWKLVPTGTEDQHRHAKGKHWTFARMAHRIRAPVLGNIGCNSAQDCCVNFGMDFVGHFVNLFYCIVGKFVWIFCIAQVDTCFKLCAGSQQQ